MWRCRLSSHRYLMSPTRRKSRWSSNMPKLRGASTPVLGSRFQRGGEPSSMPRRANTSNLPAAILSAAARYGAASTLALACIQRRVARARSGGGTTSEPRSPQRSARISIVLSRRWRISVRVMQRNLLSRHRSHSFIRAATKPDLSPGSRSTKSCADILSVPNLEIQERPEQLLVVLPAVQVIGQHPVEDSRVAIRPDHRRAALQVIQQVVAHLAAKPLVDRDTEAHFRPIQDAFREQLLARLPQYPLAA